MGTSVDVRAPDSAGADLLALFVAEPALPLPAAAGPLGERLGERIAALAADGELTGAPGQTVLLHLDGELGARRLVLAGTGPAPQADADALRTAAAAVARAARATGALSIGWLLDPEDAQLLDDLARAIVEGVLLGGYDPARWKTAGRSPGLERLTLLADPAVAGTAARTATVCSWVNRARDLANEPPNDLTPGRLANDVEELAGDLAHVRAETLGPEEIERHGMGALAAVGRGSDNPPRLVVLRYEPPAAVDGVHLGLVGKAITFDTGGISLKPALYMEEMKGDMAGGAAVIAALGALAELGIPLRTTAVVAAAENMVGSRSFRPGDILRAMSGTTIEVVNTDCEGRLVLADALWYARREGATHLLDLATLTGSMVLALGDLYAGVFGNEESWRDAVVDAGNAGGDHAWPMPLHPRYRRYIDSAFADLKNHSILKEGSPPIAAEFLQEFAGEGPWAHVDMAGPAFLMRSRGDYLTQRGGTGYGVRLIVELATRLAACTSTFPPSTT